MKLIDDWKAVAAKAWSVRWIVASNALAAAPLLIEGLDGLVSSRTFLLLTFGANMAALVARFIKQDNISGDSGA